VARVVDRVGARLEHIAEDRVVDVLRFHACALDRRLRGRDAEFRCSEVLERATKSAERRTDAGKKHDVAVRILGLH
jgi:hypothetical protein